ncbi:hypothetical protein [Nostoc sp. KVJ3]|nr:hypothetical protein [Nostoc sp. KVJ3]
MTLGRQEGLAAYDAAYLELALRLGLPLATIESKVSGGGYEVWRGFGRCR